MHLFPYYRTMGRWYRYIPLQPVTKCLHCCFCCVCSRSLWCLTPLGGNLGHIKSLADRRLAPSASGVAAGCCTGRGWEQPLYFPAFLCFEKDNKQAGTGSLSGTKKDPESKNRMRIGFGGVFWSRWAEKAQRLKYLSVGLRPKSKAWWECLNLIEGFLRSKPP